MLEYIKKLVVKNEDKLFTITYALVLTAIFAGSGFLIKYYYFSNDTKMVNSDNRSMSFDDYKRSIKEITTQLATAHNQEKIVLEKKLQSMQQDNNDLEKSYKAYVDEIEQMFVTFEEFKKENPKYRKFRVRQ